MSDVDVLASMERIRCVMYGPLIDGKPGTDAPLEAEMVKASEQLAELLVCYDSMLSRWWSNVTQADKELGNRAGAARMRFNGHDFPKEPPIDETLGERRRGETR